MDVGSPPSQPAGFIYYDDDTVGPDHEPTMRDRGCDHLPYKRRAPYPGATSAKAHEDIACPRTNKDTLISGERFSSGQ